MKRIRKTLPSGESQNPSTSVRWVPPDLRNEPKSVASVKGLRASGEATFTVTSTKSYASTLWAACEKDTSLGAPDNSGANANIKRQAGFHGVLGRIRPLR